VKHSVRVCERGLALAGIIIIGLVAAAPTAAAQNPSGNEAASATYLGPCDNWATAPSSAACPQGLGYLDALRATEGVVPMTLPTNFGSLSASEQLFVFANLERVDRGMAPLEGISSNLDSYAQVGAQHETDPHLPPGLGGGGNWAGLGGGINLFEADTLWMYEDGPGGANAACTSADAAGCWGHRDNILGNYSAPALMGGGAATVSGVGSIAELFASGDSNDAPYFTWSDVTPNLPVGAWPPSFSDSVPSAGSRAPIPSSFGRQERR